MRVEFVAKSFPKTESMEQFINDHCQGFVETYLKNERDVHIRVSVDEDRHRNQNRKPHFLCEFQIKTAGSKKWLKTHKTSNDFHTAVNEAVRAMKHILEKKSDRRHHMKSSPGDINAVA